MRTADRHSSHRTRRPIALAAVLLLAAMTLCGAEARSADRAEGEFQRVVVPFLNEHCIACHGADTQEGKLRLDRFDADAAGGSDTSLWSRMRQRLVAGEMPPAEAPQPDRSEVGPVIEWLTHRLIQAGADWKQAHRLPEFGNQVPHDLLFGQTASSLPAATPARLWRIRPEIYWQFLIDFDPNIVTTRGEASKFSQPFSASPSGPFSDFPGDLSIDDQLAAVLAQNARTLVEYQTELAVNSEGEIVRGRDGRPAGNNRQKQYPKLLALVDPDNPPTPEEMETAIRLQFQMAVRREPGREELARFLMLMEQNIRHAGQLAGVRTTLAAVLLLPEIYLRKELGEGEPDEYGRRRLGPRERAFAIAYALTDSRPDDELLAAIEEGRLATREEVRAQVERILNDPATDKPRVLRFFREYFDYTDIDRAFKDQQLIRDYGRSNELVRFKYEPESLVRDTDLLIGHILETDRNVLVELLTTNRAFVNFRPENPDRPTGRPVDKGMTNVPLYNLSEWPGAGQPVALPRQQRAGILTQPSWLAVQSLNDMNDVMHRGKWIRERLLGDALPDVPLDVDATVPVDPSRTLRERLETTRQAYCWQCHQKMNPLGLSFEMFDMFGRSRTEELGRPVDATGELDGTSDPGLDGAVAQAVELMQRLARSERVRQVFIRHAFRYWMGRAETLADSATLLAADRAYLESGGSMKALITSLLTSDSFLYRVPLEPDEPTQ